MAARAAASVASTFVAAGSPAAALATANSGARSCDEIAGGAGAGEAAGVAGDVTAGGDSDGWPQEASASTKHGSAAVTNPRLATRNRSLTNQRSRFT